MARVLPLTSTLDADGVAYTCYFLKTLTTRTSLFVLSDLSVCMLFALETSSQSGGRYYPIEILALTLLFESEDALIGIVTLLQKTQKFRSLRLLRYLGHRWPRMRTTTTNIKQHTSNSSPACSVVPADSQHVWMQNLYSTANARVTLGLGDRPGVEI